jgi:uncharacterized membrane protein YvlD (DUF360 family)
MRVGWIVVNALVLPLLAAAIVLLTRRKRRNAANILSSVLLAFVLLQLLLWGMASHLVRTAHVHVGDAGKLVLLASAGGLAAQLIYTWAVLGRVMRRPFKDGWFWPYALGAIGIFAGLFGLLIVASTKENIEEVSDQRAALFGFAAGAFGAGILKVARSFLKPKAGASSPDG